MTAPPTVTAIETWARLARVSFSLLSRVETDLKTANLPPLAWYDVLLELKRAGDSGLRPFQLQDHLLLAQYNLSRLVDRLVNAGHIDRAPSAEDGRGQVLTISSSGIALLDRMWPVYRDAIECRFAAKLDDAMVRELDRILGKLGD